MFKWAVSLALIVVALSLLDWSILVNSLESLSPWVAILVVIICLAEYPVLGYRWHLIARSVVPLPARDHIIRYCAAQLFNLWSPGQLGGDIYRYVVLRRHAAKKRMLLVLLVQERVIGLAVYLALFLLAALLVDMRGENSGMGAPAQASLQLLEVTFTTTLVLILTLPRIIDLAERAALHFRLTLPKQLLEAVKESFSLLSIRALLPVVLLTVIAFSGWCLVVLIISAALGVSLSIGGLLMVCTLAELVRLVPLTVQGLGVREGTFAIVFGLAGQLPEVGFVVGVFAYLAVSVAGMLVGSFGLFWTRHKQSELEFKRC